MARPSSTWVWNPRRVYGLFTGFLDRVIINQLSVLSFKKPVKDTWNLSKFNWSFLLKQNSWTVLKEKQKRLCWRLTKCLRGVTWFCLQQLINTCYRLKSGEWNQHIFLWHTLFHTTNILTDWIIGEVIITVVVHHIPSLWFCPQNSLFRSLSACTAQPTLWLWSQIANLDFVPADLLPLFLLQSVSAYHRPNVFRPEPVPRTKCSSCDQLNLSTSTIL